MYRQNLGWKCCLTCSYWGGNRKPDVFMGYVECNDGGDKGYCCCGNGGAYDKQLVPARNECSRWTQQFKK